MTYVITLHGILQQPNGAPNPQGLALYQALSSVGRLAVLGGLDRAKDEWFLATQGLDEHADFLPESIEKGATELDRRLGQIGTLRAKGTYIALALEPDPEVVAAIHAQGVPTLLYLHPQFSQPAFRPDHKSVAKPWNTLVESVQYQEALKAVAHIVIPAEEEDPEE